MGLAPMGERYRRPDWVRRVNAMGLAAGGAVLGPGGGSRWLSALADGQRTAEPARQLLAGLSDREREVLMLLGRGLSNADIGGTLHLSEATVKTHVARILGKLSLRDRVQAVVVAYETGLVTPGGV